MQGWPKYGVPRFPNQISKPPFTSSEAVHVPTLAFLASVCQREQCQLPLIVVLLQAVVWTKPWLESENYSMVWLQGSSCSYIPAVSVTPCPCWMWQGSGIPIIPASPILARRHQGRVSSATETQLISEHEAAVRKGVWVCGISASDSWTDQFTLTGCTSPFSPSLKPGSCTWSCGVEGSYSLYPLTLVSFPQALSGCGVLTFTGVSEVKATTSTCQLQVGVTSNGPLARVTCLLVLTKFFLPC